jgi:hypothetical protein
MINFNDFSFHDSTVINIKTKNDSLFISLEDVKNSSGEKIKGEIVLKGISKISVDEERVDAISQVYSLGVLIDLEATENNLSIIVAWHDFKPKKSLTLAYSIDAKSVDWIAHDKQLEDVEND